MPSLPDLQGRFVAALDDPSAASPRGIDVYRHAIAMNYLRAMGASFPVVRALMGEPAFEAAVAAFVAVDPPQSGDLNVYGERFAAFLAARHPAASMPGIAGMARLEWAVDESMRAPEAGSDPAMLVAALGMLDEEAVPAQRLRLHPSCRFVAASHATFETWGAHQRSDAAAGHAGVAQARDAWMLVRREADRPLVESIAAAEFAWLTALQRGESFGDALGRALEVDGDFDLARALEVRVHDGTICALAA